MRVSILVSDASLEDTSKSAIGRGMTAAELRRFAESVRSFIYNELDNSFPWADAIREITGESGAW